MVILQLTILLINGEIRPETFVDFKNAMDKLLITPAKLVIESGGGNMGAAIAIGMLVKELEMDVEVRYICASSCANYIFPSGKNKRITENALVIYHGGGKQENLKEYAVQRDDARKSASDIGDIGIVGVFGKEAAYPQFSQNNIEDEKLVFEYIGISEINSEVDLLDKLIEVENTFYGKLNVDSNIAIYGQKGIFEDIYKSYEYSGFYYALEEMEKMGLKNISVIGGEWHPEENAEYSKVYLAKIHNDL